MNDITDKLAAEGKLHLLKFADELTESEKEKLFAQIRELDFSILNYDCTESARGKIEPIPALSISESENKKDRYREIGLNAVREGKIGALLLAGGHGSRLGFDKPK